MALDVSPFALWEEADAAIKNNRRRISAMKQMVDAYRTPWHEGTNDPSGMSTGERFNSRNHPFEYIAMTIANVVFSNPRWQVTANRGYANEVDAPAIAKSMNAWTKETRLKEKLAALYVDYCFHSCYSITSLRDVVTNRRLRPGEIQRRRPDVRRIGPSRFFRDHRAFDPEDCRFTGHIFLRDLDDLKAEDGWDKQVLSQVPTDAGVEEVRGKMVHPEPSRKEIALIEMYVPEHELPDDDPFWKDVPDEERDRYHGTIFTLPLLGFGSNSNAINAKFPLPPRPWYGDRGGPYQIGGTYPVPDDVMPLSNLIAVQGQNLQNNEVARALHDAIVQYKKIILTSGNNAALGAQVKRARHGAVLPANLQDLARMIAQIELGGPTPALLQGAQISQDTLDRSSGMTDAMRGNVTGDATAFENSLAASGATARSAFPKQRFIDFVADIGRSSAWFIYCCDDVVMDLEGGQLMLGGPPNAHAEHVLRILSEQGVPMEIAEAFVEFQQQRYESTPFEAFGFAVEPLSTERASDPANRARIATVLPMVLQLAQVAPTMPWVNVKEILTTVGQAFDLPDLHRVVDSDYARMIGMQQQAAMSMSMGMPPAGPSQESKNPRMSSDLRGPVGGAPNPQGMRATPFRGAGKGAAQGQSALSTQQPKQVRTT